MRAVMQVAGIASASLEALPRHTSCSSGRMATRTRAGRKAKKTAPKRSGSDPLYPSTPKSFRIGGDVQVRALLLPTSHRAASLPRSCSTGGVTTGSAGTILLNTPYLYESSPFIGGAAEDRP